MNVAWEAWVDKRNPPARATVEARLAAPQYLVEIEQLQRAVPIYEKFISAVCA